MEGRLKEDRRRRAPDRSSGMATVDVSGVGNGTTSGDTQGLASSWPPAAPVPQIGDGRNGGWIAILGRREERWSVVRKLIKLGWGERKTASEAGGARGRKPRGETGERGSRAPGEAVKVAGWLEYGSAYSIPRVPNRPTIYIYYPYASTFSAKS